MGDLKVEMVQMGAAQDALEKRMEEERKAAMEVAISELIILSIPLAYKYRVNKFKLNYLTPVNLFNWNSNYTLSAWCVDNDSAKSTMDSILFVY